MLTAIYVVTLTINVIFVFLNRNSNIVTALSTVVIGLIMAGNTQNPDSIAYMNMFSSRRFSLTYEWGFKELTSLISSMGVSYNSYLLIIIVLCLALFFICYRKYIESWHFIIVGYMTFLMFYDTTQIRYFIAGSFVIVGISFLALKKRIAYAIMVVAGSLFHRSAILFLCYLFIKPGKSFSKKSVRWFLGIIVLLCVITFLNGNQIPFINTVVNMFLGESEKSVYFTTTTRLGFLYSFLCQFLNIYTAGISNNIIKKYDKDQKHKDLSEVIYLITCVSCFALPLVMMNTNFTRYLRINNILILMLATIVFQVKKKETEKVKLVGFFNRIVTNFGAFYVLVFLNIITWVLIKGDSEMIDMILNNNLFF